MFDSNKSQVVAALLVCAASAGAARLCAEVTDPARLPLPRVLIQIQNLHDSGESQSARTDAAGKACVDLPEGVYAVEASLPGFVRVRHYPIRAARGREAPRKLQLPLEDPGEGGFSDDVTLSGVLKRAGKLAAGVDICLFLRGTKTPAGCDTTNWFGEYVLVVRPGVYSARLVDSAGELWATFERIEVTKPGVYRNWF